jgi:CysZ protein
MVSQCWIIAMNGINLNVSESVRYIRKYKGVAIGNGFIFSLLFAFPIIGSMLSTVLAPVAATIAVVELKK